MFRNGNIKELLEAKNIKLKSRIKNYAEIELPNEAEFWQAEADDTIKRTLLKIPFRIQNYQHGGAIIITDSATSDLEIKYKINYDRLFTSMERLIHLVF